MDNVQDNKMEQWPVTFDNFEPRRLHTNRGMRREQLLKPDIYVLIWVNRTIVLRLLLDDDDDDDLLKITLRSPNSELQQIQPVSKFK
jgi:hypothetical protein